MIFDTFMYNGEEDILDIRLNTLNSIVDKFIILESPTSHSLLPRNLEFEKQKERFRNFENKISYHAIDYCKNTNFLLNDWAGRDVIQNILFDIFNIKPNDIIIHGDLDEIPRVEFIKNILNSELNKPCTFMLDDRKLCLDLELRTEQHGRIRGNFPGSILFRADLLNKYKLYWLRQIRLNGIVSGHDYKDTFELIENGGWHFGYCAGIDRTVDKFKFFCHANEMNNCIKDRDGLINCIKNHTSFDGQKLTKVNLDSYNFPQYVFENPNLFANILSINY